METCTGDPVEAAISGIRFLTAEVVGGGMRVGSGSDLPFLDAECGVLSGNDPPQTHTFEHVSNVVELFGKNLKVWSVGVGV